MSESFRPSKRFLIRGAVATGIVAAILIVQTDWFRALFNKPPLPPIVSDKTVGEFIAKDSNGNGIADWEEKLWGLDPTALYTNGVPNKTVIEQKKMSLGMPPEGTEPENETDALARELLTITAALGQSGEFSDDDLASVGARLAESVEFQQYTNHYSLKDLRTVPTTSASLQNYYNDLSALTTRYRSTTSEIDILVSALETGNTATIAGLAPMKTSYQQYASGLVAMSVPIGIQREHLEIANSIYGFSVAVDYLMELETNGANALAGVALYKISDARLAAASEALRAYLVRYGILQQ